MTSIEPNDPVRLARSPGVSLRVDIVVPLYNEQSVVGELHRRLSATCQNLSCDYRIIYVDDGSHDQTVPLLQSKLTADSPVEIVQLSRNFGQMAAIQAGMSFADGDAVVVLDGDLQDPPELISEMVDIWKCGADVVIARRNDRQEETRLRKLAFVSFHWVFQRLTDLPIPKDCGTYSLLDTKAVQAIRQMPEAHRFFPGLRAWVGFRQEFVEYARPPRAAGGTKQSFSRLFDYALNGILGYSRKPAKLLMKFGFSQSATAVALLACGVVGAIMGLATLWTWGLIAAGFLLGLAGTQTLGMGFLAEQLSRVYEQTKNRPPFIVRQHFVADEAQQIRIHSVDDRAKYSA
ncbi:MAG: glycosyltransferase family 2 protein [Pirellulaceae bacterium]|nr:glycosyltransferase family 2 protein [Pirellulaceae bacterium]